MDVNVTTVTNANLHLRQLSRSVTPKDSTANETLVIFFSWLGASTKALQNYFNIYHSMGHDILHVPGTVTHFAWPPTSVTLAKTLLEYVCQDLVHYRYLLVHSTSIGSYNYTSCLIETYENPTKYWTFGLRLVGNVFDSITYGSYDRMRIGVSYGLTKNSLLQIVLQQLLAIYFILTKSSTVKFYEYGMDIFAENQAEVPSIFFYSKDDPLCDHELIDSMVEKWRTKMSPSVLKVCWNESLHAGHLFKHRDNYMCNHAKFMKAVDEFREQKQRKAGQISTKSML